MTFESCLLLNSFGIDFQNLAFEIYIPKKNQSQFYLLSNQIIIDRTDIIKENFRANLPMMIIDTKIYNSKNKSIILIEQENDLTSIQTANVTIIFNHHVSCILIFKPNRVTIISHLLIENTVKYVYTACLERLTTIVHWKMECHTSLSSFIITKI